MNLPGKADQFMYTSAFQELKDLFIYIQYLLVQHLCDKQENTDMNLIAMGKLLHIHIISTGVLR